MSDDSGLHARREPVLEADARVSDRDTDPTAPQLHGALFEAGLAGPLLEAVEQLPGERSDEIQTILVEAGVDALDGLYAGVVAKAATLTAAARERPDDDRRDRAEAARQRLVDVSANLGRGTPLGYRSSRADLTGGPVALLKQPEVTPTVEVTLTSAFVSRRPEQREDVLEFLTDLALACDVRLVLTGAARRCIHESHRAVVPAHVTNACNPRRGQAPSADAEDALASLEDGGTPVRVLEALSASPTGSLSYADLRRELFLADDEDALVRQTARRLEERHGLVERVERTDGQRVVSITPAGEAVVAERERDEEIRRKASTSRPDSGRRDTTPKILPPCRVNPPAQDRGEEVEADETAGTAGDTADAGAKAPGAAAEGGDRPAGETAPDAGRPAGEAAEATRETGYAEGPVDVEYMSRPRHVAAATAGEDGEVALVDAPLARDDDGRRPWWSFDADRDELVVGAEYYNPMQLWVALARSLSSTKTLEILRDALGENLEGLEEDDRALLRSARCIGWLSDDSGTDDLVDDLNEAREELLEKTADLKAEAYDDRNEHRSETLRFALGLAGTIVHLLELVDVDVVREVRVPEYGRHFSREEKRADLTRTLATGAAIQSRYGHFAAFRQLFEEREDKRNAALNPRVEPGDAVGSLIGTIVVVGDGVTDLEDELAARLDRPREVHPDAPEFGVRIPIVEASRTATSQSVSRILREKRMRPTREAVDVLHGFASDPYAAAEGLNRALEAEESRREIHLDEARRALASLETSRLLPDAAPSERKGVAELLRADEPLSQAELCRRADISTQSWRNHRETLEAVGLVTETGEGWRVCLPFAEERYGDVDAFLPWFLAEEAGESTLSRSNRQPVSVLQELVFDLEAPIEGAVAELTYPEDWPVGWDVVTAAIDELGLRSIWPLIRAGCGDEFDPVPREVTMGSVDHVQTALPVA